MLRSFLLIAALSLFACKQGEGERCQVDSDCKSGLACSPVTNTCKADPDVIPGDGGAEADAMPVDADLPDAEPDGPPPPQCSDTLDNDLDTFTDFPDDPQCTDALDNDESA